MQPNEPYRALIETGWSQVAAMISSEIVRGDTQTEEHADINAACSELVAQGFSPLAMRQLTAAVIQEVEVWSTDTRKKLDEMKADPFNGMRAYISLTTKVSHLAIAMLARLGYLGPLVQSPLGISLLVPRQEKDIEPDLLAAMALIECELEKHGTEAILEGGLDVAVDRITGKWQALLAIENKEQT